MTIASHAFGHSYIEWRTDGNHIHQRAMFAVEDKARKWLAWYLFVDGHKKGKDIETELVSGPKEYHVVGSHLLDGGLISNPHDLEFDALAPRHARADARDFSHAILRIDEDPKGNRFSCQLTVNVRQKLVMPMFRFRKKAERWNPVNRRDGVLWLLGIEMFKSGSLVKGPTKAVYGSDAPDPYTQFFSS